MDPDGEVDESNEGNNKTSKSITIFSSLSQKEVKLFYGWNLISLPLKPSSTNLDSILAPIDGEYNRVISYDASDSLAPRRIRNLDKPFNPSDVGVTDQKVGLFIYITEPGRTNLNVQGAEFQGTTNVSLYRGWNMVGFPSNSNRTLSEALGDLEYGVDVISAQTHNVTTGQLESLWPGDLLRVGHGYWIEVAQSTVWEVQS